MFGTFVWNFWKSHAVLDIIDGGMQMEINDSFVEIQSYLPIMHFNVKEKSLKVQAC